MSARRYRLGLGASRPRRLIEIANELIESARRSNVDVAAAYSAPLDALLGGDARFDAAFGREVVRVLALANERLVAIP